jgi:hypothetical protein
MEDNLTTIERDIPIVSEYFTKNLPINLYHYTDATGLLGISNSSNLFLTDIRFLNDRQEFYHAFEIAAEFLQNFKYESDIDYKLSQLTHNIITGFIIDYRKEALIAPYVISFSVDNDNLSLWRGYCTEGGYSIGINSSILLYIANKHNLYLRPCLYSKEIKLKIVEETFKYIIDVFKRDHCLIDFDSFNKLTDDTIISCINKYISLIMELSPVFKHESFKDEQEWRIFTSMNKYRTLYHNKRNNIVPYIELDISNFDGQLIFSNITCSPKLGEYPIQYSIENFFNSQNIKYESIDLSKAPFRA